ncbi:MAG TPA: RNA polymerase factor sigma-54 [Hyphomicrobiaceae bacterium]|jgi:RNA polymerase sigma-54 factor|nr:RNA polymerase factor sigma-54 [Hyphomicrobiaceae bacterium]
MALAPKLELRQGQQLVMTPQLQQAIRLLQLSNVELCAFVEAEVERNPLLERDEAAPEPSPEIEIARARNDSEDDNDWVPGEAAPSPVNGAAHDGEEANGASHANGAEPDLGGWASLRPRTHNSYGEEANLEEFVAAGLSLADHLTEQLHVAITEPAERLIGAHLIHAVDEAGYLRADVADLVDKLDAPPGLVEKVLGVLQGFDPPGVFARDLAECLALQLKEQNRYDPQIARLLDNLALLGGHNLAALKRAVGVDSEELADMIAEIKRLNPKPGLKFGTVQIQPVLPDVTVRPARDGSWVVELNNDTLPRVLVDRSYYTTVSKSAHSEQDRGYLLDCLQSANWLVKSLDQRARTILRVAEEIVRQQDGFLSDGIAHLKPLNLKTVADAISMHESTVSRVTSNKYMATPRGVFELKYFFTSAIASADGDEAHSSEAVRHRIRLLVDAESPGGVLSDDKIVEQLKRDGIDIARRTVAKYREALRIPSSVQRRREKQMAARLGAGAS